MAVFMLETEALTTVSQNLNHIFSEMSNVSSSINGYDTACEDNFDFAGAKSVIAENIASCITKVKNTSSLIEQVVSSHEQLQNSMKFLGGSDSTDASSGN